MGPLTAWDEIRHNRRILQGNGTRKAVTCAGNQPSTSTVLIQSIFALPCQDKPNLLSQAISLLNNSFCPPDRRPAACSPLKRRFETAVYLRRQNWNFPIFLWTRKKKRVEEGTHYRVMGNIREEAGSFITDSLLLPSRWWDVSSEDRQGQSRCGSLAIRCFSPKQKAGLPWCRPALPQLQARSRCSKRSGLLKISQE